MSTCPKCGGVIDQLCCAGCGRVFRTAELLGTLPPPEWVVREQAAREEAAIREGGG